MATAAAASARDGPAAPESLVAAFATAKREPDIDLVAAQEAAIQILGVDIMLDSFGMPHLLEVNNNPSMSIDSVFPMEGPYVQQPPSPTAPGRAPFVGPALAFVKTSTARGGKPCKCRDHHRPHEHHPSAVDIAAKQAAAAGAIAIVERDRRARSNGHDRPSSAVLAEGTMYDVLV
jgi:hypothetical protein